VAVQRRERRGLHYGSAGLWTAEDQHLGVAELEPIGFGLAAVVDYGEQLQPLAATRSDRRATVSATDQGLSFVTT
jgi:hypothetical protein